MNMTVTINRTDEGARIDVLVDRYMYCHHYAGWKAALDDAHKIGLISEAEYVTALVVPPGFAFRGNADLPPEVLGEKGFSQEAVGSGDTTSARVA